MNAFQQVLTYMACIPVSVWQESEETSCIPVAVQQALEETPCIPVAVWQALEETACVTVALIWPALLELCSRRQRR